MWGKVTTPGAKTSCVTAVWAEKLLKILVVGDCPESRLVQQWGPSPLFKPPRMAEGRAHAAGVSQVNGSCCLSSRLSWASAPCHGKLPSRMHSSPQLLL